MLKKNGKPHEVFTPFYNDCLKFHKIESVSESLEAKKQNFEKLEKNQFSVDFDYTKGTDYRPIRTLVRMDQSESEKDFYTYNEDIHIHASRKNALRIAQGYDVKKYQKVRDDMAGNNSTTSTTSLSSYLKERF